MPFSKGARIEIENQADVKIRAFYFYIDYVQQEKAAENLAYFHAWYNQEVTEAAPEGEGGDVSPDKIESTKVAPAPAEEQNES